MMDDDRPTPPIRIASMREKNGSTSTDKEKEKKKGWFGGKKNQGRLLLETCKS